MDEQKWHVAKEIIAAGCGCAIVDSLFNPLEVLKVRLQRQRSGSSNNSAFESHLLREASDLIKQRGSILGLWTPGLFPTQLRGFFYVGLRIGLYPTAKSLVPVPAETFANKLISGALCGALGSTIFAPLDVVRIRLQCDATSQASTWSALTNIYRLDGIVRGLWRGTTVNVLRATVLSGTQLACYDQLKISLRNLLGFTKEEESPFLHAGASFCSGTIAQIVVMPVDTLKTAIMLPGGEGGGSGSQKLFDTTLYIFRTRGWRGFYYGMSPALMRQGPCILVQMPVIEQLRWWLGLDYI